MTAPVASAKPTARPAPSRRSARGSPGRTKAPATIARAPAIAMAVGCSPKIAIAPTVARSGPVARAIGYTSDKSPTRYPAVRVAKYRVCKHTATRTKTSAGQPSSGRAMTRIAIANGAKTIAPTTYARNRNGVAAPTRFASKFLVARRAHVDLRAFGEPIAQRRVVEAARGIVAQEHDAAAHAGADPSPRVAEDHCRAAGHVFERKPAKVAAEHDLRARETDRGSRIGATLD